MTRLTNLGGFREKGEIMICKWQERKKRTPTFKSTDTWNMRERTDTAPEDCTVAGSCGDVYDLF